MRKLLGFVAVCGTAFLLLGSLSPEAIGASLLKMSLVLDGSADPPGDRLDFKVLFEKEEAELLIEIRPFLLRGGRPKPGEPDVEPQQLEPQGRAELDATGKAVIRYLLRRTEKDGELSKASLSARSVAIPFAALKIPFGIHRLCYEVRLLSRGVVQHVQPTPLTFVQITEQPRLERKEITTTQMVVNSPRTALIVKDGRAETQDYQKETESRPRQAVRAVATNVPGGYVRAPFIAAAQIGPSSSDDKESIKTALALERIRKQPWVPSPQKTVYYATNRNIVDAADRSVNRFGHEVSKSVSYGETMVRIPIDNHERGTMEQPSGGWWKDKDPREYFVIERLAPMAREVFAEIVGKPLATQRKDVMIFVHGYNNTMDFSILRFAQLIFDIRFQGTPLAFSWPSEGSKLGYWRDEKKAAASYPALALVIYRLIEESLAEPDPAQRGKIHLIAHSMGNRVLLRALHELRDFLADKGKPFGHIILAAPDVDIADFVAFFPAAPKHADSVTLYFCSEDKALLVSQELHKAKRLGQGPIFIGGLENIDSDKANTSFLGHDYFVSKPELLIDIELLVTRNFPPPDRPTLREASQFGYKYWMFP